MRWFVRRSEGLFYVLRDDAQGGPGVLDSRWFSAYGAIKRCNALNGESLICDTTLDLIIDHFRRKGYK